MVGMFDARHPKNMMVTLGVRHKLQTLTIIMA
jgi:hypothetical protein